MPVHIEQLGPGFAGSIDGLDLRNPLSEKEIIAVKLPPINWTSPVPTRLRTPSTSVMILETKAPDLLLSKNETGSFNNFCCTLALSKEIRCWASTLNSRVKEKELIDCKTRAIQTTISKKDKVLMSLEGITSSIRVLLEYGSTSPDKLRIIIKNRPRKTIFLLGQINSLKAQLNDTLFLFILLKNRSKILTR